LAAGLVWGWLPCGLVYYSLLIAAPLGDALTGTLFMLAFGLGTLPGMYTTGVFGGFVIRLARNRQVRRFAAGLIVVIGLVTLLLGQTDLPHRWMPAPAGEEGVQHEHQY
jgi:sulfite exporter TauE/SafE